MSQTLTISVAIAPGELIDKITILEIKRERITDSAKLGNIATELRVLNEARTAHIDSSAELVDLTSELRAANEALWKIEDDIRDCERRGDFGSSFVELARSVYHTNDRRCAVKRRINELMGSGLIEEKSYTPYSKPDSLN
jgi:hypothetical protein